MEIINITPHAVNLIAVDGTVSFPSEGVARVETISEQVGILAGFPIMATKYGATHGLPEPSEGKIYIVSMVVAMANPQRFDIVSPNTSPASTVRDEAGQIVGVKSFSIYK